MLKTCDIIDGQALVQSLGKQTGAKTFGELADLFITAALSNFNINFYQSRYQVEEARGVSRGVLRVLEHPP